MADPIPPVPNADLNIAGGLSQAPKPLSAYESQPISLKGLEAFEPTESATPLPLSAYEPGVDRSQYQKRFSYAHRMQTDADFDGSLTVKRALEEGRPDITADTVEELNLFGEAVSADVLRSVDGGEQLLDIAARNRKGRRGFLDALITEGSATDFMPFVGDLAGGGLAIRDMVKAREVFKKGTEQGFQNLTLEEKVTAKLFMEEGERASKQTLGATVGTIVRQAPAFALEMLAYGYGFKRVAAALGIGGAKRALRKSMASAAVDQLREKAASEGLEKVSRDVGEKGMESYLDDFMTKALTGSALKADAQDALVDSTVKAAQSALNLMQNPSRVKSFANWATEYATRGVVDHFDDVIRTLPPSVKGKLTDAAGVLFIEAPVKGLLYGTFDAAVVNPIGARLAGADEAVTKTELGLGISGMMKNYDKGLRGEALAAANEETLRNAQFLAWGASCAEYGSEVSGRAFNNLGAILTENIGGDIGRRAATRGLRAVAGRISQDVGDTGAAGKAVASKISETIDKYVGKEASWGTTLSELRKGVAEAAAKGGALAEKIPELAGKSANDIMADGKLMDRVMKQYFQFKDKSFYGYWLANKAVDKGVTPQSVQRALEKMSYDEILGEFMEERYNGFAQGLFGLDGEEHDGMVQRLAHSVKSAIPTWQQGAAEVMAFALPVYGRAMINRAYTALGSSPIGKFEGAFAGLEDLVSGSPQVSLETPEGIQRFGVESTGTTGGNRLETLKFRLGRVRASEANENFRATSQQVAEQIADAIPDLVRIQHGKTGILPSIGRVALKVAEFAITGNPAVAFNNPADAIAGERFGLSGKLLLSSAQTLFRSMYLEQLGKAASASANEAGAEARGPSAEGAAEETPAEAAFNNPSILGAIRPRLVAAIQENVQAFAAATGNNIITETDIGKTLDTVFGHAVDGKVDGKTRDEFRKSYIDELTDVAKGRLTADVDSGSVRFFYNRRIPESGTVSAVAKAVESTLARNHAHSFVDLDTVADPEIAWRAGQSDPVDMDLMQRAADGDDAAVMQVADWTSVTGLTAQSMKDLDRRKERAREYARVFVAGAGEMLRPTFEVAGDTVTIEGKGGGYFLMRNGQTIGADPVRYKTVAEAEQAATALGPDARRASGRIYNTPSNGSYSAHASAMIVTPAWGYAMSDPEAAASLRDNPFNRLRDRDVKEDPVESKRIRAELQAELSLAEAYRDKTDMSANARTLYDKWLAEAGEDGGTDGFETAAAKAFERIGIRRLARPDRKNESGYLFMPAALSYDGALYVPYTYLGDPTPVIEDFVETRDKDENERIFRDPRPGMQNSWRPAAKPLVQAMNDALNAVADDTANYPKETIREARWLARNFFNPDVYTQEGMSHLTAAIIFMRGDAAAHSTGADGVSAYYATLGAAAKRVRASKNFNALDSFTSLVGRLAKDGRLTRDTAADSALARLAAAFIPDRFQSDSKALRDMVEGEAAYAPLADVTDRAAFNLDALAEQTAKGIPQRGLIAATPEGRDAEAKRNIAFVAATRQSLEDGGNVVFDEDLPWMLEELYTMYEQSRDDGTALDRQLEALRDRPEGADESALADAMAQRVWVWASNAYRRRAGYTMPGGSTASMAARTIRDYPMYVIEMARNMGVDIGVKPGDEDMLRRKLGEIAEWWFGRDGLAVPPDAEARFVKTVFDAGDLTRKLMFERLRTETQGRRSDAAASGLASFEQTMDALFGEETRDAEAIDSDVGSETDQQGEGDDRERGSYSEWANGLIGKTPEIGFFGAVMGRHFPHAQGNMTKIVESLWLRSRGEKSGTVADGSLVSLFDGNRWGDPETGSLLHPAFETPAAYTDFLSKAVEKGDPVFDDMIAVLKALGHRGGFRLADRLKGAYRQGIFTVTLGIDSKTDPAKPAVASAKFRMLRRSAPASLQENIRETLEAVAGEDRDTREARIRDVVSALIGLAGKGAPVIQAKTGEDEAAWRSRAEAEVRARIAGYAKALTGLLGPRDFVASGLSDPTVVDTLTRVLMEGKNKTLTGMFLGAKSKDPAVERAGYLHERIILAAMRLRDPTLSAAERAVDSAAELTRGDMIADVVLNKAGGPLGSRGGFNYLANVIASVTPVSSANRTGKAQKRVSGECCGQSGFFRGFLDSKVFEDMYLTAGGRKTDLPYARRAAVWPDGTPVQARLNGIQREEATDKVSRYGDDGFLDEPSFGGYDEEEIGVDVAKDIPVPDAEEVKAAAEAAYDDAADAYVHVAVYAMDKDHAIVNVPRSAVAKLPGVSGTPPYSGIATAVAKVLRVDTVSAKRSSAWLATGPALTVPEARMGVVVPVRNGKFDADGAEAWHGQYYYGARLQEYYKRQGFVTPSGDPMSAKHILVAAGPMGSMYTKGQSHPVPSDTDIAAVPDLRFIRDLLDGEKLDALVDLDSLKESVLLSAKAGGVKLVQFLAENPQAEDTVEVTLTDGVTTVGALKAALGLEVKEIETDGGPAVVLAFVTDLSTQQVGAAGHGAKSDLRKMAANHGADSFDICGTSVYAPQSQIQLAYLANPKVRDAILQDVIDNLDEEEAELLGYALASGAGYDDPRVASILGIKVAAKRAKVVAAKTYGPYAIDKSRNGDIDKDVNGVPVRLRPWAAESDPLLAEERDRTDEESQATGGLRRVAADVRFNSLDPFTRYGMRAKTGMSRAAVMDAVRLVVQTEETARRTRDPKDLQAYWSAYNENILKNGFTDGRGNALPSGAVYNFRDLVRIAYGSHGEMNVAADPAAFRDTADGVVVSGREFMTGRTPSGNELRNEWVVRAFEPADTVKADGSRRYTYMKLVQTSEGWKLERTPVPAGTAVARDEAAGEGSPKVERISGRDNDGDHSDGSTLPIDRYGISVVPMSAAMHSATMKELANRATTAERAAELLNNAEMSYAAKAFQLRANRRLTADPNTKPVGANPLSEEAMNDPESVDPVKKFDPTDPDQAAALSKSNHATAESRGVIVAVKSAIIAATHTGLVTPAAEFFPGLKVGGNWKLPAAVFRPTIDALEAIANSTFDDIKVQLAGRAGFFTEILDLYAAAAASAGIRSQKDYDKFHKTFRRWLACPVGKAVLRAASLARRPTEKNGGYKALADLAKASEELADSEDALGLTYLGLDFRHRPSVAAVFNALEGRKLKYEATLDFARALSAVEDLQAVKKVMDFSKAQASVPADVLRMGDTVRRVERILKATDGDTQTVLPYGEGRTLVEDMLASYKGKMASFHDAHRGSAELSAWVAKRNGSKRHLTPGRAEQLAKEALAWLPFRGAARVTPAAQAETLRKLATRDDGSVSTNLFLNQTVNLLAAFGKVAARRHNTGMENFRKASAAYAREYRNVLGDMRKTDSSVPEALPFEEWLKNPVNAKGGSVKVELSGPGATNMAIFSLLTPGERAGNVIGLTGTDGSAASLRGIREGMAALRDGTDGLGEVEIGNVKEPLTGKDLYWALMHYAVLTGGAPVKATRGNRALFPALFDGETQAKVAASVARDLANAEGVDTPAVLGGDKAGVYDGFTAEALPWGEGLVGESPARVPTAPKAEAAPLPPVKPAGSKPVAHPDPVSEPAAPTPPPAIITSEVRAEVSAARVNGVKETPASAAVANLKTLVAVAAGGLGVRERMRLPEFLAKGEVAAEDGKREQVLREAGAAAEMLRSVAGHMVAAPGSAEILTEAARVIGVMGYAEPTVIAGAVFSAGLTASAVPAAAAEYQTLRDAVRGNLKGTDDWSKIVRVPEAKAEFLKYSPTVKLLSAAFHLDPAVMGAVREDKLLTEAGAHLKVAQFANTIAETRFAEKPVAAQTAEVARAAVEVTASMAGEKDPGELSLAGADALVNRINTRSASAKPGDLQKGVDLAENAKMVAPPKAELTPEARQAAREAAAAAVAEKQQALFDAKGGAAVLPLATESARLAEMANFRATLEREGYTPAAADALARVARLSGFELKEYTDSLVDRRGISEIESLSGLTGKDLDAYRATVRQGQASLAAQVLAPRTGLDLNTALDSAAQTAASAARGAEQNCGLAGRAMANAVTTGFASLLKVATVPEGLRKVLDIGQTEYGNLMAGLHDLQVKASDFAIEEGRLLAEAAAEAEASGDAKAAAKVQKKREDAANAAARYLAALRFLRMYSAMVRPMVAKEDGSEGVQANPLRAELRNMLDSAALVPPAGVDEPPPMGPAELVLVDPETGTVDASDTMLVAFVDTDAWFRGAVLPTFMGKSMRDVLMDKDALALVPLFYTAGNINDSLLGIDSETGIPRKVKRGERAQMKVGEGWVRMAGKGEEKVAGEVLGFERRGIVKETGSVVAGKGLTEDELELLRWYSKSIAFWLSGRRDRNAVMMTGVSMNLAGLRNVVRAGMDDESLRKLLSIDEAKSRIAAHDTKRQVLGIHHTLDRVAAVVPKAYHAAVESALFDAARKSGGGEQEMTKALEKAGFIVAQHRGGELVNVVVGLPCGLVHEVAQASSGYRRLTGEFGRRADEITPEALADRHEKAVREGYETLGQLSWTINGDGRLFHGAGGALPFFAGNGAVRHYANAVAKPPTPEYSAEVQARRASLVETLRNLRNADMTVREAVEKEKAAGLFSFLSDLVPEMYDVKSAVDAGRAVVNGSARRFGITADTKVWDAAKTVYQLSVRRLMESAWDGGLAPERSMANAGFDAFNRALETVAVESGDALGLPGATYAEIYDKTGALPLSLTSGELLAHSGKQIAESVRFRSCLTRMLLTQDEDGMPLVYARPGTDPRDDTVPDRVWEMAARWWVDSNTAAGTRSGLTYDSTRSGRENAVRLYDIIVPALEGAGGEQSAVRGVRRNIITAVKKPDNMTTFSAIAAMKNRAGDDTKSRISGWAGGEAANYVQQLMAVGGYTGGNRLAGMNRWLSWSKSCSVMASFFFPIATALESPWAAIGFTPTVLGPILRKAGIASDGGDDSWLKKLLGNDAAVAAPHMIDVLGMIGTDDPALMDLQMWGIMSNLSLADRARNMTDHDRQAMSKDIKDVVALSRQSFGSAKASRTLQAVLEGAMEHPSELAFEYVINATKIAVFAQMNARLRQRAIEAGRWWDPVRDMRDWSNSVVNPEVGGIDPAMYPFMTPVGQSILKTLMFSWEWTLGAWDAGGGNILTRKLMGTTTAPKTRGYFFGRWLRMYCGVMAGIPLFMQAVATGIAKAAGEGDDDDKWLYRNNEYGKDTRDFDITPLLRTIANKPLLFIPGLPTLGDIKKKVPGSIAGIPFGDWIPGLTGQEGDKPTTRKRRYYMHLGKQGWEVAGWYENPVKSFLGKLSMPVQRMMEGVFGISPSMGWDMPWKELGFWERWINVDPETSASVNLLRSVMPFSFAGAARAPEAGIVSAFGPVSKGMSEGRAKRELTALLKAWSDSDTYAAEIKGRKGAWTDLKSMSVEWLEALRRNGYDPDRALSQAMAAAREPLYRKVHAALPTEPGGKPDTAALNEAAAGLYRLNFMMKSLRQSIKTRDKRQNISRASDAELSRVTNESMRWAFGDKPLGTPRDAAFGGDVRGLLATDEVPKTLFGYRVVGPEALPENMKAYFAENPQAAGHFEMNGGK